MPLGQTIAEPASDLRGSDRLVLGTAQLGMAYGIANRAGQPSEETARALVGAALAQGVHGFDTAECYGDSERVLGRALASLGAADQAQVISKGRLAGGNAAVAEKVAASCERLGVSRLAAWLLHDEKELTSWSDAVAAEATALKRAGTVGAFGVSVYHPECALRAVEELGLAAVQFPASPFDRRFLQPLVLNRLARAGTQLYVRSVFLQGLGLMSPDQVPEGVAHGKTAVAALHAFCRSRGFAPDQFCLQYVLARTAEAHVRVVLGAETTAQWARNVELANARRIDAAALDAWDERWPDDFEDLVLPFRWRTSR